MISTMDSISGGRMELGIGAGWKRDEWLAYGYGFPETRERLARLGDDLGVITAMLAGDRHQHATYEGRLASVKDAINVPKPIQQPRVPIMVGGNGPERHLAPGRPPRRRAQPRRHDRRPRWRTRCRSSPAGARRSTATRPAWPSRSTSGRSEFGIGGAARTDLLGRLSRARASAG